MRIIVLFMIVGFISVGCASSSPNKRAHDGPATPIGEAPQGEEAEFAPPPEGPDLMMERSTARPSTGAAAEEEGDLVISRAQLDAFLAQGPAFALSQVDTEPFHEDGDFVGFQIADVTVAAHSHLAPHLRVGDVITHINGLRLKLPNDYLQAWNGLTDASSVRIDFVRDGEGNHVTWQIR